MLFRQLPNFISALRLAASPVLAVLLLRHEFRASLVLIAFAGVTDWLDGFAARRLLSSSRKTGADSAPPRKEQQVPSVDSGRPSAPFALGSSRKPGAASTPPHKEQRVPYADSGRPFAPFALGSGGKMGVVLDPLADKTMLVTLFVTLTVLGLVPAYLLALVIVRDLVIVTGAALLRFLRNVRTFLPTMMGKVSTFFQIAYVITVVLAAGFPNRLFWFLEQVGLISTIFFTFASGVGYVQKGIRLTRETANLRAR